LRWAILKPLIILLSVLLLPSFSPTLVGLNKVSLISNSLVGLFSTGYQLWYSLVYKGIWQDPSIVLQDVSTDVPIGPKVHFSLHEVFRPFPIMLVKLAYYAHSNACYFLKLCSNYAHFSKLCSFGCKKCSALIRRNGYNRSAKAQQHVLFDCFRAICAGVGLFPASLVLSCVACNHRVSTYIL
jgi:hypothetical protein